MGDVAMQLFERREEGRWRLWKKVFRVSVLVSICFVWIYRLLEIPTAPVGGGEKTAAAARIRYWGWIGMVVAEVMFGFYWILSQAIRWNVVSRFTFKDRLSQRYENKLPPVDIFVCTADPTMEPPSMVVNTVLSVLSYNYPPEKLSVYLSDDGCSEFTYYALIEAAEFSKHWIPFCKKFNIEPRSPDAYFAKTLLSDTISVREWSNTKKLYEDMKRRIDEAVKVGSVAKEVRQQNKGFSEWHSGVTKSDHNPIVQIIIDGRDNTRVDSSGSRLPTMVYLAREKRPNRPHNFKAGSMNALIRVSSEISNAPLILNLDCDMYSTNADAIREALCFFMDEEKGDEIAFVQFAQYFSNITPDDIYFNSCTILNEVELSGIDAYDSVFYAGTDCFHRRAALCGSKYSDEVNKGVNLRDMAVEIRTEATIAQLQHASKVVASCSYEDGTLWGKEIGLIYGCAVEDMVTGIAIQCRGWKSVFYSPKQKAFLGLMPITLEVALVQFKRWSEGMFQIFISKYCPFTYGHGNMKLGAQMSYSYYMLWAAMSLPTLYYIIVPPLFLLSGISLFPKVSLSNFWLIPFAYAILARNIYSLVEAMSCGVTLRAWWNSQRMLMIRRTTSFPLAFIETILTQLGFSEMNFVVTTKVATEEVLARYEKSIMEFGSSSIMFVLLSTWAMLNLFCLVGGIAKLGFRDAGEFVGQFLLTGSVVLLNRPVYEALFVRQDKGCLPGSVMFRAIVLASIPCLIVVSLL